MIEIIHEDRLRALVTADQQAFDIVEQSFIWKAQGKVDMPPIMHLSVPRHHGDIDIKSAYVEGLDNLTVKLGSGFFDNVAKGLPSSSSVMVVMSSVTGFCEAILLENGYLTNLRTGMAGAVAAKWLAPARVNAVGIIGAGAQARFQIECLKLVRNFDCVHVYSQTPSRSETYAEEMRRALDVNVVICASAQEAVEASQIVVTTTPAHQPIVRAEWLHKGLHITALGADVGGKQELDADCLRQATAVFCDSKDQCFAMGELQHCPDLQQSGPASSVTELGDIVAGRFDFRRTPDDITVCDLTGMGVQDTAIAHLALRQSRNSSDA